MTKIKIQEAVEDTAVDETAAEQNSADESTSQDAADDEASADEDAADEVSAEQGSAEEGSADEDSAEDDADEAPSARPALVDESAFGGDDDEDDEDFGHMARLVTDDEEDDNVEELEPAAEPEIPLNTIDSDALWVVKRLRAKGFEAYLTGGCVRDLLLGREPKDFDVATAATPEDCKATFRNCRLIGRRFRLAHVYFPNNKVIETATFRANPFDEIEAEDMPEDLLVERDNVFGTVEDDARRRDLTVNGLFYDPIAGKVIDFVGGREDLEARLIRTIGDPQIRFQEDPVRILRAIKFATRLDFNIEKDTMQAMRDHVADLTRCAPPRLLEELNRLLTGGHARRAWLMCRDIGVLGVLLPELEDAMLEELTQQPAPPPEPARSRGRAPANRSDEDRNDNGDEEAQPTADDKPAADADAETATDDAAAADADAAPAEVKVDAVEAEAVEGEAVEGEARAEAADEAAGETPAESPAEATEESAADVEETEAPAAEGPAPQPPPPPPHSEERMALLDKLLGSLDQVRSRGAEISSAAALTTLVLSEYVGRQAGAEDEREWLEAACNAWTERLRMTRRDRETMGDLLRGIELLAPMYRRGRDAKSLVARPWFREALLVYTVWLHARGEDLEEIGKWKAIASAHGAPYRQPKPGEKKPPDNRRPRRSRRGGSARRGGRKRG